jgi:hypothetical protein
MKIIFSIVYLTFLLVCCDSRSDQTIGKSVTKIDSNFIVICDSGSNFIEMTQEDWIRFEILFSHLYSIADTNYLLMHSIADSLITNYSEDYRLTGNSINLNKIYDLHFLKGETYYKKGQYKNAVKEFSLDNPSLGKLSDVALGRAAAYVKLKQFDKAYIDLAYRTEFYYGDRLELANYYEIIGNIDSAQLLYIDLWKNNWVRGSANYATIPERIKELYNKHPKLLTELSIPTRRPEKDQ